MFYILSNLTEDVVRAPLNSSINIYLGPGAESKKILASEINNNSRLKRLKERGIIDLIEVEEKKTVAKKPKRKAKAPKGKPKSTARAKKARASKSKSASGSKKKKSTKSTK
jgi:hypothetical protein